MYRAFARHDPEHRARRKLERAAARRRNDQNWGALWAASAEPELVAAPPASPDDGPAPAPAPETAARDAEPAAALVTLLRARDEPAAAAALSHEKAAAPPSLHDDAEPTAAAPPPPLHDDAAAPSPPPPPEDAAAPPPPPPQDSDDESAPLRLPATGQTGTQWSQWTTGPASQRAASQWATPPPPAWDDALRRHLRVAAPVDVANAACVAYADDERARAALPTMNVSRGDVDVLFAPEEGYWD